MKRLGMIAIVCGFAANVAFAQGQAQTPPPATRDDLDVTMRVIVDPDAKAPDEIVRRIPLPRPAPAAGRPANAGKPDGAARSEPPGEDVAAEAREKGREFGQETAERAREIAEEARRNGGPPDGVPGPPVTPPGPPITPPGPPITPPGGTSAPSGPPVSSPRPPRGT